MSETPVEYPQDAKPVKNRRRLRIILGIAAAVVIVTGATAGGVAYANGVTAQREHLAAITFKAEAAKAMPGLQAQTAAAAQEADSTTADQVVAAEQARVAAALAAQQAAEAAAKKAAEEGPIKCPAGTHAMAVDANGNESNCDPLNGAGQPCEAYDANNQCTAWLKP